MKETTIYQFIKTLQKKGVWNGIAGSCSYWATRADYLTIYEYVQTNFPTHPYGYLVKTANALSNKRLGGGGTTGSIKKISNTHSEQWRKKSSFNYLPPPVKRFIINAIAALFFAFIFAIIYGIYKLSV